MRVLIKNKFMSIGGGSSVTDENNVPVFNVKGKAFSITRKKYVCDLEGNMLYMVRNKYWKFFVRSALIYNAEKEKIAKVKEKVFTLRGVYYVQGYEDEIVVEGGFFTGLAQIYRNGEIMGTMSFRPRSIADALDITDSFVLEADEKDMPFLIALVIAVDNIRDRK